MSEGNELENLANLVRAHGYRHVIRAGSYLWSVSRFIKAHEGRAPSSDRELAAWWHEPYRTTEREGQSWRIVTNGADVAERARKVLDEVEDVSMSTDQNRREADRLKLVGYLA